MWRRTGSDPETAKASREGLTVGMAGTACLALLDATLGMLADGVPPAGMLAPLAAATLFFAGLIFAPWLAGRLVGLEPVPLAAASALGTAVFFALDLIHRPFFTSPATWHRLEAGAVLACALGAGVALYLLLRRSRASRLSGRGAAAAGVATAVLAATALLIRLFAAGPPASAVAAAPGTSTGKERTVRRIILLTVDTLRADVLSAYDGRRIATPHIDRLAADSVLFRQAVSPAPWTVPAFASIMTGLLPQVHGTLEAKSRLPDELQTLAERLRDAGYATAAIGFSDMLAVERNLAQGFERYDFVPVPEPGISFGERLLHHLDENRNAWRDWTDRLPRLATGWLEKNRQRDFFLWLHYYDPHLPYTPPARWLPEDGPPPRIGKKFGKLPAVRHGHFVPTAAEQGWIRDLYEAEVRHVDESVGRLLETLERLGLYDDSLIVFTSDHGEEFWEHGGFEHGHSMHREVLRVPLLIKLPGSRPSPIHEIVSPVSTAAILPTVLELCGLDYRPTDLSVTSLAPLLAAGEPAAVEPIVSTGTLYYEDRVSIAFERTKYVRWLASGNEDLYDLAADPQETVSIADSAPDRLEVARQLLADAETNSRRLRGVHGIPRDGETAELDADTLRRLRALGYVE